MGLIKSLFGLAKAKSDEAAQKIEDENAVSFAQQDIAKLKEKIAEAVRNVGRIKGTVMSVEQDITTLEKEIEDRTASAKKLLEAGKEEIAQKQCAVIERLENEVETKKSILEEQKNLLGEQEKNRLDLQNLLSDSESNLNTLKSMEDVRKSTEALSEVDTDGANSLAARIKERQERARNRFNTAKATREASKGGKESLDEETAAALGNSAGSSLLAKLKSEES
jgi:phage shock protein A